MAQRALREYDGKAMVARLLPEHVRSLGAAASVADASAAAESGRGAASSPDSASLLPPTRLLRVALPASGSAPDVNWDALTAAAPWVQSTPLVVKPDQLIKRRGKGGLIALNVDWPSAQAWIVERMGKPVVVDGVAGTLTHFLVEPFLPHAGSDEYYAAVVSVREGEEVLFYREGGVDVGDVDAKASRLLVPVGDELTPSAAEAALLDGIPAARKGPLSLFLASLHRVFVAAHFTYLEINPLVVQGGVEGAAAGDAVTITPLDMAAKVDEAAEFLAGELWGENGAPFPPPFGRQPETEEAYVHELDGKTGASLKLTLLNRAGRVWTMVAGGGASVAYADTVVDMGAGAELANYGEYSGAPTESQTYEYARTLLGALGSSPPHPDGKVLLIGGGIANFTDVAKTFGGIIKALREAREMLLEQRVSVWVRRGGPNYAEGLRLMRELGEEIGVPIRVYGPDTHITAIVALALGKPEALEGLLVEEEGAAGAAEAAAGGGEDGPPARGPGGLARMPSTPGVTPMAGRAGLARAASAPGLPPRTPTRGLHIDASTDIRLNLPSQGAGGSVSHPTVLPDEPGAAAGGGGGAAAGGAEGIAASSQFSPETRCIVWGMQQRAVQGMLDFDLLCKRERPSVAAMVFPFSGNHYIKLWYGTKEVMVPVYASLEEALRRHLDVTVLVNFASFRSVFPSTMEALNAAAPPLPAPGQDAAPSPTGARLTTVTIIAEGVPERQTRLLIREAARRGVCLIGPATVGGIAPGCFRIGNTGGMIDNVIDCKLYRPGSVAYVSKSGGMSNELNNLLAQYTDGVAEGVAIGGDRFPGSRFLDHLLRFQANPRVKMLVLLGEVGGNDEYAVAEAIRDGRITKPVVAWCIGTCAKVFPFEVQFGHAGALAGSAAQTADAKNGALAAAGAIVPDNFNDFARKIRSTFASLVEKGEVVAAPEAPGPRLPMDYAWARSLGLVRKPAAFVSSISDDRGEELLYAGVPISKVFEEDLGIGGVVGLLWFRRRLPPYAARFIEMVLMVVADHGPAVSGAHNTIVTARAGKDLISSLCSGLLTIGPRFGGALDEAAAQFSGAYDARTPPAKFVSDMRAANKLIMGIGHRVKSVHNPDKRVTILKDFALKHFPSCEVLNYALAVEAETTKKRDNLILNVDGVIAVAFTDLLRNCGAFTREEADEALASGCLNGLFVLGRSIGFIGHYLDQVRLKQGLYRHPTDDIAYMDALA